jgi:hypothetical protein
MEPEPDHHHEPHLVANAQCPPSPPMTYYPICNHSCHTQYSCIICHLTTISWPNLISGQAHTDTLPPLIIITHHPCLWEGAAAHPIMDMDAGMALACCCQHWHINITTNFHLQCNLCQHRIMLPMHSITCARRSQNDSSLNSMTRTTFYYI